MDKNKKHQKNNFKVVDNDRRRVDYPRKDHHEEYAAEVAPPSRTQAGSRRQERQEQTSNDDQSISRIAGYIGLGIGIASLFMWSIILGPVAAVIGYYVYSQGNRTIGAWSAGLGILAAVGYFVLNLIAR
ncbi:hypothetical protein [Paenibacillus dakarensis]|uniref:hypothetical protein n=1 Tax=Paenibacillus dakarensis TaxID=1527293 RepID=UPI0006D55560|nr:hypothetical protein [Paenibacillus dakarensis]